MWFVVQLLTQLVICLATALLTRRLLVDRPLWKVLVYYFAGWCALCFVSGLLIGMRVLDEKQVRDAALVLFLGVGLGTWIAWINQPARLRAAPVILASP